MILALRLPRSGRKAKPGVLAFDAKEEGGRIRAPLLLVSRRTRARALKGHLVTEGGERRSVRVAWPRLDRGLYLDVDLEVIA